MTPTFSFIVTRCESHNVYVSSSDGELPQIPTSLLSKIESGLQSNVVVVNEGEEGTYQWRVDCVEEDTGNVRIGEVWAFTIDSTSHR